TSDPNAIGFEVRCNGHRFDATIAIPLGLILNEIISNSLKHAFKNGSISPKITIDMPDAKTLIVSDNGCGLPRTQSNGGTLGLRIVGLLADQIHANIEMKGPGTTYQITFA